MRKVSVAEWVKALRSGEFPKGRGRLQTTAENRKGKQPEGFCCLGVYERLCKGEYLSPDVQDRIVNTPSVRVFLSEIGIDSDYRARLAYYNDRVYTFNEMADMIEAHIAKNQEEKSK